MKPTLFILAAGLGSRYGGLKQLDSVGPSGETLLEYSVYDAIRAGFDKVVFVIQEFFSDEFKQQVSTKFQNKIKVEYAYQELEDLPDGFSLPIGRKKPWGTAHAILSARKVINQPFVVINADDYYGPTSYKLATEYFGQKFDLNSTQYAMVGYQLKNTYSKHGSVNRGICQTKNHFLVTTEEVLGITPTNQASICTDETGKTKKLTGNEIVSMNFWLFTPHIFIQIEELFKQFLNNLTDPLKQEFFIPNEVSKLINSQQATVQVLASQDKWFGITYKQDKKTVTKEINKLISQKIYPTSLWK